VFDDSYSITEFRGDPTCHFEIMTTFSVRQLGVKMPIHTRLGGGGFAGSDTRTEKQFSEISSGNHSGSNDILFDMLVSIALTGKLTGNDVTKKKKKNVIFLAFLALL